RRTGARSCGRRRAGVVLGPAVHLQPGPRHSARNAHRTCRADAPARSEFLMYAWIKAFHIIAVIAWMAGMLYLPRLFVYHCEAVPGSRQSETFKVMERRLLKAIINPAMAVTWIAGLYLAWSGHWYTSGWFHAKLTLVLVLSGVHGFFFRLVKDFA